MRNVELDEFATSFTSVQPGRVAALEPGIRLLEPHVRALSSRTCAPSRAAASARPCIAPALYRDQEIRRTRRSSADDTRQFHRIS